MAEAVGEQAMHLIAGVRDTLAGLMARVVEDCIRTHLVDPEQPLGTVKAEAVEQLPGALRLVACDVGRVEAIPRSAILRMMLRLAQRFLLMLVVFAVVGAPTAQLAQAAQYSGPTAMAEMPCGMAVPAVDMGHGTPMAPCKGLTPDCIKQMGCVIDVALPVRLPSGDVAVTFSTVAYWAAWSEMAGLVRRPEPFPPRTA
jgi:hypothetical protein